MRPRLASRPLWRLPTQSQGRGSSGPRRCRAARRRGAARPRVPLRHRVAVWTLPSLVIFLNARQKPRSHGAFSFLIQTVAASVSPVTTSPVAAAPATTAMPAPMPATPAAAAPTPMPSAPAAMTAATATAAPAHFFRCETIGLLGRCDGGLGIRIGRQFGVVGERRRHQRRGLRTRCKCDAARSKAKGEFQKVAAFHRISSSVCNITRRRVSS